MNKENRELFNRYLEEEKLAGHTKQGFTGLKTRIPKLFVFLEEMDYSVSGFGVRQAQEYQGWLIESGRMDGGKYSPKTVNAFLVAATSFCEFTKRKHLIPSNPFKEIRKQRIDLKLPRNLLKEKELDEFLERLTEFEKEGSLIHRIARYKAHVIAELQYSTGLRISEVAALKEEDIDFNRGLLKVEEGKAGKSRMVILNDYAGEVLRIYVEKMRPLIERKPNKYLFCVKSGWLIHAVNAALKKVKTETGLGTLTSHSFRHSLGYHLLRAGCNIRHIQQILGHRRLRNTEIYTQVDKEDLKEVLDVCHPRQWRKAVS